MDALQGPGPRRLAGAGGQRLRGINNNKEYKATENVSQKLRRAGGSFSHGGGSYSISSSDSAGLSIKRTIPESQRPEPHIISYIFHL